MRENVGECWVVRANTALYICMAIGAVASVTVGGGDGWHRPLAALPGAVVGMFGGILAMVFAGRREVPDAAA